MDKAVDTQLLWLDAQQTMTLLKVVVFDIDGPDGDEISLVFPNGWKGKTACQQWPWGSRYSCPIDNDWSQRDKNGFLEVVSVLTNTMNMAFPVETTYYQWQNGYFRLVKQTTMQMHGDSTNETIEVHTKK